MIAERLEDTLNGGYKGVYGEVVEADVYKLKELKFKPNIIYDIGANIGVFSRYAMTLFPNAIVIAVEPHPENCFYFKKFTHDARITLIEKAIGNGNLYYFKGAANGSGECYISSGVGYEESAMNSVTEKSKIETIMPSDLINDYWLPNMKSVFKLDIEGGENCIFNHKQSVEAISKMDYICAELHFYALTGNKLKEVRETINNWIKELSKTHTCELDNVIFWATKKTDL